MRGASREMLGVVPPEPENAGICEGLPSTRDRRQGAPDASHRHRQAVLTVASVAAKKDRMTSPVTTFFYDASIDSERLPYVYSSRRIRVC